jgi:Bacterial membrane protein YfhO
LWRSALLALVAVWMLAFAPQIFMGRTFVLGDAREFRTYSDFSRARWLAVHERTFWNPYVFAGIPAPPSLADSRPQYLPDAWIDVYEHARMPNAWPLAAPLLAHLLGMFATAALARRLWGVGSAGMVAAGLVWGLSPILLGPFTFGHDARLVSASLMPLVLLTLHAAVTASAPRRAAAAALVLALTLGVQVLNGHPQIIIYSGMLAVAFGGVEMARHRRLDRLWLVFGAFALGAAMAAAVWLPAMNYSSHSFRGGQGELGVSLLEVKKYSNALRDLVAIGWAGALGAGDTYWGGMKWIDYTQYMGLAALLLAALAWRRMPPAVTPPARVLAVTFVAALLVSLGTSLGPLYSFLHAWVPLWSKFRVPAATLLAGQLALALLTARAFTATATSRPPGGRTQRLLWIALGLAILVGIALASGMLAPLYERLAEALRPTLPLDRAAAGARRAGAGLVQCALIAGAALAAMSARARGGTIARVATAALVVLLALDLGLVSRPLLTRATGRPSDLAAPAPRPLVLLTAADHTARAFPARNVERDLSRPLDNTRLFEFASNYWISWRARSLAGNHGAVPAVWRPIVQRELTRWYPVACAFGAVYIAADSGAAMDTSLYAVVPGSGDPPVYRLRRALGRAYSVELVAAPGNDLAVVDAMASRDFVPNVIAFASESDPDAVGTYPGSPASTVRWIRDDPDHLELDVVAPARAFVVVADTFFPGWTAELDGAPLPIHRVNQVLRGVAVPAGHHRIRMTYVPEGWIAGVFLTRAAMALWLILALWLLVTSKKARPHSTSHRA